MTRLRLILLALLTACGNVTADDAPDAGGGDDTTPPAITSSTPADGATRVSLIADLELVFDEPLDPASVTAETFTIDRYQTDIPVDVSYDAETRTVTLAPQRPLYIGYWTIAIDGVTDLAGNPLHASRSFTTFWNENIASTFSTTRYDTVLDDDGLPAERTYYTNDVVTQFQTLTYALPHGLNLGSVSYGGPSTDDPVIGIVRQEYDGTQLTEYASYSGAGPDGVVDTADDVQTGRWVWTYGDDDLRDDLTIYDGPGADTMWSTADDQIALYITYTYDAEGRTLSIRNHNGAGPDTLWKTADDHIDGSDDYEYRADGNTFTHRDDYGVDGVWGTADDVITLQGDNQLGADGQQALVTRHTAGDDGLWGTADDPLTYRQIFEYDDTGSGVREITWTGPGGDGVWATADDVVNNYQTTERAANGNRQAVRGFSGPGDDGDWLTADDAMQREMLYETDL